MALDPTDDEIYRRLMPVGDGDPGTGGVPAGPPDTAMPGAGVANTPAAFATMHVSPAALRAAGRAAGRLGTTTSTARARLAHAHDGLGKAAAGFTFAAAVTDLHTSWSDRLAAVSTDCEEIDGLCQDAAKAHETTDVEVKESAGA